MTTLTIAFFEIMNEWEKDIISSTISDHEILFFEKPIQEYDIKEFDRADILSVFIYSEVTAKVLEQLPNIKFIATRSTGFDHIDLAYCNQNEILVSNVPYYGENTVAEHTFALIMAISRNVHKSYLRVRRNDYSIEGLKGFDLQGKTIGIIGTGRIGIHVVRIARGFGMKVIAYDINKDKFFADLLGFEYCELDELLARSDIVSLHVPYNKYTHHLINTDNLDQFKKGSILINTARGKLIQTEALLQGLQDGIFAGAGLDVLDGEEYIKEEKRLLYDKENIDTWTKIVQDHMILSNENVVFTPHIAFYSQEALERIMITTTENIVGHLSGSPQYLVNNK